MFVLATGIEQFVALFFFLLFFVVLRWFQRDTPKNDNPPPLPEDLSNNEDQQDRYSEESMRRFMDALGLPEGTLPPQVLVYPQTATSAAQPPPPPPQPPPKQIPPPSRSHRQGIPPKPRKVSSKGTESKEIVSSLSGSLRNVNYLQKALILREVLGPPKALE